MPVIATVVYKGDYYGHLIDRRDVTLLATYPDEASACQAIICHMQNKGICTHKALYEHLRRNSPTFYIVYNRKQMHNTITSLKTSKALHRFFKKYCSHEYRGSFTFRIQHIPDVAAPIL